MADGLKWPELSTRRVETLEEAFALIEDLRSYELDSIARQIGRNSEYEREISDLRAGIDNIGSLVDELVGRYDDVTSQRTFLAQTLVAIVRYEGPNPEVVRTIAAAAVDDFLPGSDD